MIAKHLPTVALFFGLIGFGSSLQAGGGDVVGNGGGLAENNLVFAWKTLPESLHLGSLGESDPRPMAYLVKMKSKLNATIGTVELKFGDYSSQAEALVLSGSVLTVDTPRIYPGQQPWSFEKSQFELIKLWFYSDKGGFGQTFIDELAMRVSARASEGYQAWDLGLYDYPEIRLARIDNIYYFQDHARSYAMAPALNGLGPQIGCTRYVLKDVTKTRTEGIVGSPGSGSSSLHLSSKIVFDCDDVMLVRRLNWKIPMRAESSGKILFIPSELKLVVF